MLEEFLDCDPFAWIFVHHEKQEFYEAFADFSHLDHLLTTVFTTFYLLVIFVAYYLTDGVGTIILGQLHRIFKNYVQILEFVQVRGPVR